VIQRAAAPAPATQLVATEAPEAARKEVARANLRRAASNAVLNSANTNTLYGRAYHLYWQGDYAAALELLSHAGGRSDSDARIWYYKGLAEAALGRPEAQQSLARAAQLERKSLPDHNTLGHALERVQGPTRQLIREAREAARP
jgi:tetratricopeptide (TPR) repeat protein